MTDLIERYLGAVARQLPDAQKADVTAELRDVLLSQAEEAEAALGRPLTRDEVEALLIRFGHPLTVAGRYRKVQHLIGPEIFPFWWAAVKVGLAITAGVYLVLAVLIVVAGRDVVAVQGKTAPDLTVALTFVFGAITFVCALIERFGKTAILTRWKPRRLPPARGPLRSRFELVAEIGLGAVALLWWTGVIHFRDAIPEIGLSVHMAAVWDAWFWPVAAYWVFELVANLLALFRPAWARLNGILQVVRNLAAATILSAIYQAGHWLEVTSAFLSPTEVAKLQANFDLGMKIGIAATILIFLIQAAIAAWRLRDAFREGGRAAVAA